MQRDDAVLFEGTCIVTTYENGSVWLVRLGRDSVIALVDANGDATISAWGEDVSEDVARKGRCWINTYLSGAIRNAICIGVHGDIPELANNPIRKEGRCVVEYHGGVYLNGPCSMEWWSNGEVAIASPSKEPVANVWISKWNYLPYANITFGGAEHEIGQVTLEVNPQEGGACWFSAQDKVCLWSDGLIDWLRQAGFHPREETR